MHMMSKMELKPEEPGHFPTVYRRSRTVIAKNAALVYVKDQDRCVVVHFFADTPAGSFLGSSIHVSGKKAKTPNLFEMKEWHGGKTTSDTSAQGRFRSVRLHILEHW